MRVLVDAMLLGGRHSGVEVTIEGLCSGLGEVGGDGEFVIAHRRCYDASAWRSATVTPVAAPGWANSRPGRILWERLALPGLGERSGAQVLHAPGYVLPGRWPGPAVLTVHDLLAVTHPEWCKWANVLHYRRALPRSVRRAQIVVTPSECVRRELTATLGTAPEKVRVVPWGLSAQMRPAGEEAVARARQALGLPKAFLLWVGNIEPKKNLEGIIGAFERACGDLPHELVLAGKAAWKSGPILARLAASPAAPRIRRVGYVPAELLPALYSAADLLVHWSLYEGAGLPPLEAMACGTPAVVSDGGALPELAGQVAPVVPLGEVDRLAAEMVALVRDRERHDALARRGQVWAQQFTWQGHARRMVALYSEAAERAAQS